MKKDQTSIIHPSAKIDDSVEIGPHTIIEADVEIGAGSIIESNVRIFSGTRLGKENHVCHGAVLGCLPQHLTFDKKLKTGLSIGDKNSFREYSNIHRASHVDHPTTIGNENYFMGNTHVGHDCIFGNNNVITQGSVIGGHTEVGNRTFISGLVAVHQFCRIGDFALIAGNTKITQDLPPYMMVDYNPGFITGLNLVGIRRSGMDGEKIRHIKNAFKRLFRSEKFMSKVLEELKAENPPEEVLYLIKFIEKSKRGIIPYKKASALSSDG